MCGRPSSGERRDIAVVSDLHLARGRAERFFLDSAFKDFLRYLLRRGEQRERPWRLVLLGDTLDLSALLLHDPQENPYGSAGEPERRLATIVDAHPTFFRALGDFVDGGGAIDFVPGNHDIDLVDPAVEAALRRRLAGGSPERAARITFHPWFYYVGGVLYAEHGNQYHDINSFLTLLEPYRADELERPLAWHLERHSAREHQARSKLGRIDPHLRLVGGLAGEVRYRSSGAAARRRRSYRDTSLRRYAAEVGLPHTTLVQLDELAEATMGSILRRLARRGAISAVGGAPQHRAGYLHRAWPSIHAILDNAGLAVPYYVFGHTHHPERRALGGSGPWYLNTGAWASSPSGPAVPPLTFVEILLQTSGTHARLRRWIPGERRAGAFPA